MFQFIALTTFSLLAMFLKILQKSSPVLNNCHQLKESFSSVTILYRILNLELKMRSSSGSTKAERHIVERCLLEVICIMLVRKGMNASSMATM